MNRQQRRAAAAHERRWKDKMVVETQSFRSGNGMYYWFEQPEGWTREDGVREGLAIHGPFTTKTEADENQRLVLLGPDCKVTDGGMRNPAWDRLQ
jgi:hypothetical protein